MRNYQKFFRFLCVVCEHDFYNFTQFHDTFTPSESQWLKHQQQLAKNIILTLNEINKSAKPSVSKLHLSKALI